MRTLSNFDPDLTYEIVWSGGELLPPREEASNRVYESPKETLADIPIEEIEVDPSTPIQ